MAGYLKRLVSSLAAYQVADLVSKFIAVLLLPVYTRYISPAGYGVVELLAQRRDLHQHRRALRDDRVVPAFLLRRPGPGAARRAGAANDAVSADRDDDHVCGAGGLRDAAQQDRAQPQRPDDVPGRGAGAVVVHQPRARLRGAARRRAPAPVRGRLGEQRADDDRGVGRAGSRPARWRPRPAAGQLRRFDGRAAGAVVHPAPPSDAAAGAGRADVGAVALRAADGARRGVGLRAQHRRPLLHLPRPQPDPGRAVLDRRQARRRGRIHRAGVSVRVAAAGLLGAGRCRGGAPVRAGDHLLPVRLRLGRRRADTARDDGCCGC